MCGFYGMPTRSIGNAHLRLEFLTRVGPRIVRLFLAGSDENQLAEAPDLRWETPFGDYHTWGGHRLWHAPEAFPRTYIPDDGGLTVKETPTGVRLCQPTEVPTGIRKCVEIHLHADRPALTLAHRLQNDGLWPVELAPWAITQLPLGGVAVLPLPCGPPDAGNLLPNRCLALWPYTVWPDPRLDLHTDYLLVQAQAHPSPCKVGYLNHHGWAGYVRGGIFFCKRFEPHPDRPHPDLGCNVEVYCNDGFIELETLAPLQRLEPGQTTTHVETWEFYPAPDMPPTVAGVRELVRALGW